MKAKRTRRTVEQTAQAVLARRQQQREAKELKALERKMGLADDCLVTDRQGDAAPIKGGQDLFE